MPFSDSDAELRQQLNRIELMLRAIMDHLNVSQEDARKDGVSEGVRRLVRLGRKIEAIKLHREETGVGLAEAKSVIDFL